MNGMAKERPTLTSLSERRSRKTLPTEPAASEPSPAATAKVADNRVQIIVRMTTTERKALRQIALDQDTTAQALAEEAIRDVLRRHGHKTA